MASSPGKFSARAAVLARGAGTFTGAAEASSEGCHRAAARSASCSSGQSPISDVPASYGQPVSMCKPSRPLTGTWSTPCVCPPPRSPSPQPGTGSPCLLSSRFHHRGAYITTRSTSDKHLAFSATIAACYVDNVISPFVHRDVNGFSQVTALPGARDVVAIPSISPRAHRLAAFLHRSSTGSCTEW
jgi:hypothetical protein